MKMARRTMTRRMTDRICAHRNCAHRNRALALSLTGAGGLAVGLALALALQGGLRREGMTAGESLDLPSLLPRIQADVGKGEYLFLPCRKEMWVVNRVNGKLVHYQFFDNEMGTVERSRIAAISTDLFPLRDTDFILSDRNLNSYLWVANRTTGDFQLWRASRDGTLHTDEKAIPAGEHLRAEAITPEMGTGVRPSPRPGIPASDSSPASPKRRPQAGAAAAPNKKEAQ
jgi:hypothetical protein